MTSKYKVGQWVYTISEKGIYFKNQIICVYPGSLYRITGRPDRLMREDELYRLKRDALTAMKEKGIEKKTLKQACVCEFNVTDLNSLFLREGEEDE